MQGTIYSEYHKKIELYTKALGHITRLKILKFIADEFKSVNDIAKEMGLSHSVCSAHLGVLWRAGLVDKKRVKNFSFYKLNAERFHKIQEEVRQFIFGE